jgi:hypothetical protein
VADAAVEGREEPVASLGESFDEVWSVGRIPEGFTQFVNGPVQTVIEIDKRVRGPEFSLKFLSGDDRAPILEQHR